MKNVCILKLRPQKTDQSSKFRDFNDINRLTILRTKTCGKQMTHLVIGDYKFDKLTMHLIQ
jgi:hypothetical protein